MFVHQHPCDGAWSHFLVRKIHGRMEIPMRIAKSIPQLRIAPRFLLAEKKPKESTQVKGFGWLDFCWCQPKSNNKNNVSQTSEQNNKSIQTTMKHQQRDTKQVTGSQQKSNSKENSLQETINCFNLFLPLQSDLTLRSFEKVTLSSLQGVTKHRSKAKSLCRTWLTILTKLQYVIVK